MVGLCLPQVRPSQTSKALARWEKIPFAIFVNWKEILCQYIRWKSISLFLCRLTSQARATMRTSSLVPAWRSLLQVRLLDIPCWLDLSWQFWLCWSLSTPRHSSHFGRSFPLRGGSSCRYGVWGRSCGGQVKNQGVGITFTGVDPHPPCPTHLWSISFIMRLPMRSSSGSTHHSQISKRFPYRLLRRYILSMVWNVVLWTREWEQLYNP